MMQAANKEPKIKITSLKPPRNPELEEIRESVLSQKINNNELASNVKDQVKNVHAAYLFSSVGKNVLASLCKVISSTPPSPYFSSWKDLGSVLGLSNHELGCIEHYKFGDPTEIVLKAYSQNWASTLDQIVSALQAINRFDAIFEAENGLQELVKIARQEQIKWTENNNEIYSISGKGTIDGILRPDHVATLSYQLPITLRTFPEKTLLITDTPKCNVEIQNSSAVIKKKEKKFSKAVMLTFAADGEEIARKIAKEFRKPRGKHLPIGVLLLEEHSDKVFENPEQFISHIFPQMHYIIPILTKGYLLALGDGLQHRGSSCSIDSQYVKFIHDLMMKEYIKNSCKNKRFRCIIPDDQFQSILSHKHMELDPVLKVYEKESGLEQLACRILKIRWKDNTFKASHFNRAV